MINTPAHIEATGVAALSKSSDRAGKRQIYGSDDNFSSMFNQYLESASKSQDRSESSAQKKEKPPVDREEKTGDKNIKATGAAVGKEAKRLTREKARGVARLFTGVLDGRAVKKGKKGRYIGRMLANRPGNLTKKILFLQVKKQLPLSVLNKRLKSGRSVKITATLLSKMLQKGKTRSSAGTLTERAAVLKAGSGVHKNHAVDLKAEPGGKKPRQVRKTGLASAKGKNKGSGFTGSDLKSFAVSKTGDNEPPEIKKTAGGELTAACEKYEDNVPKAAIKPDHQIHRNADEIFNDIVKQFSLVVKKGGGEARIVLQPEVLGQLKLRMSLNNHEVNTHIVVENGTVKDLILSKLNILEQDLLQQGFNLGSFEVDVRDRDAKFRTEEDGFKKGSQIGYHDEGNIEQVRVISQGVPWISTVVDVTA